MRIDEDSIGKMKVPEDALYGIHSIRAKHNFPITNEKVQPALINSYLEIKWAAAITNVNAKTLNKDKGYAIIDACKKLLKDNDQSAFIVPAIQGGAGTSTNMNVNEVIAHLAMRLHPGVKIHPNDDVNQCQSTNDTYPTAGRMAMLKLLPNLITKVKSLVDVFNKISYKYNDVIKVGRTQLQDAMPTTYGKSFHAYVSVFKRDVKRLKNIKYSINNVNIGGTAVGTGINTTKYYQDNIVNEINQITHLKLEQNDDLVDGTQNSDNFVQFSNAMKTLAVNLSKVSNDLRLLGSGPQAGLDELFLPKQQAGSSIMPSKVNPVIPEVVNQVAFEVIGKNTTVTMAAEAGQLELNAFEPIMFRDILVSEIHLTNAIGTLIHNCVSGIQVNIDNCKQSVQHSAIAATVLSPYLGYEQTTKIIKKALATNQSVKKLVLDANLLDKKTVDYLFSKEVLTHTKKQ